MNQRPASEPVIATGRLSSVHPYVAHRIETEYWYHRSAWMEDMLRNIEAFFHESIGQSYRLAVLTSTALGAKEALLTNLATAGDTVWMSTGSEFADIAHAFGMSAEMLHTASDSDALAGVPAAVFVEHITVGGTMRDLAAIGRRVRRKAPDVPLIADVSTSFGADPIDFDDVQFDGYVFTPERALGGIPGISVVAVTDALLERMRTGRAKLDRIPYTFDLLKYCDKFRTYETPYSPDITAVVGLDAAIRLIAHSGGVAAHIARHRAAARTARAFFAAAGLRSERLTQRTNAFTIVARRSAEKFAGALAKRGVFVDAVSNVELRVGHSGHLSHASMTRMFEAFEAALKRKRQPVRIEAGPPFVSPAKSVDNTVFTLPAADFIRAAEKNVRGRRSSAAYEQAIVGCAARFFGADTDFRQHCRYRDRAIGFIGAGNVVREAVSRCQTLGISTISVYSPTVARGSDRSRGAGHRTREYWESRGVHVAGSHEEIFLSCHTVVLLPTLHTPESVRLLGKTAEHQNERMVSASLLERAEKEGVMDALINSSARGALVDRKALAAHVRRGWLSYISDELPPAGDPLLTLRNACFTGHVGGSCPDTQRRVAENTHLILRQVLTQLRDGGALHRQAGDYALNVVNEHLMPPESPAGRPPGGRGPFRILLTDPFDVSALGFDALETSLHVQLDVRDISRENIDEATLSSELMRFRPHIIMLRSRTKLTASLADETLRSTPLAAVIRPGVGADNLYGAMERLSQRGVAIINEPFGNSYAVAEMTMHLVLRAAERVLLTPGPTSYHAPVFHVMKRYTAPAAAAFTATERRIRTRLQDWIGVGGEIVLISGPATSLMEAAITNLTQKGDRGLVIVHGKFGTRFLHIAKSHKRAVESLGKEEKDWGTGFAPEEIAAYLRGDAQRRPAMRFSFLCLQQNETSSGVAYQQRDLERIAQAARAYNPEIMIIIDAVSGTFAHDVDFKKIGADVVVLGSPKGLGVSSGYSYASLSRHALQYMFVRAGYRGNAASFVKSATAADRMRAFGRSQRAHYLNLLRLLLEGRPHRTDTPSVFHALSTDMSLRLLDEEGRQHVIARHANMAGIARSLAEASGLSNLSTMPSNSVTPVLLPDGMSAKHVREQLDRIWGLFVPGAQSDYWKPRLLRVGHIGYTEPRHITRCMRALNILMRSGAVAGRMVLHE